MITFQDLHKLGKIPFHDLRRFECKYSSSDVIRRKCSDLTIKNENLPVAEIRAVLKVPQTSTHIYMKLNTFITAWVIQGLIQAELASESSHKESRKHTSRWEYERRSPLSESRYTSSSHYSFKSSANHQTLVVSPIKSREKQRAHVKQEIQNESPKPPTEPLKVQKRRPFPKDEVYTPPKENIQPSEFQEESQLSQKEHREVQNEGQVQSKPLEVSEELSSPQEEEDPDENATPQKESQFKPSDYAIIAKALQDPTTLRNLFINDTITFDISGLSLERQASIQNIYKMVDEIKSKYPNYSEIENHLKAPSSHETNSVLDPQIQEANENDDIESPDQETQEIRAEEPEIAPTDPKVINFLTNYFKDIDADQTVVLTKIQDLAELIQYERVNL
ncbi:hypothetical protein DSO57_1004948 [Entomophthora muscae]|uniref:Uncharacterized protein n=1 Tax=Entomophthora muscae TaxID=34485 RepID=A0ACC2T8D0_9FUNG|nr:hypothetical protein DSO57_1004948 [Entomophthora muscae]